MKRIYLVFSETKDGKHFAHAETIRAGENLKNYIERYPSADIIHICESATQAAYLAEEWNDDYRRNKTYMFQSEIETEKVNTNLREDGTLEIYVGNTLLATIEDGRKDEKFIEEVLDGMGYIWNKDGTISRK